MTRDYLKQVIDNIIIEQCGYEKTFFSTKFNDGETLLVEKDILFDPLDAFEVLSKIEKKCGVLVDDSKLFSKDQTYSGFIDIFWNEIKREHHSTI